MIDGLRQRFTKSIAKDPWDANQELVPEPEVDDATDLPTDEAVIVAAKELATAPPANHFDTADYYKSLVETAIEQGGRYNGHQISVPWLRMILAGLEYRYIRPESLWEGVDTDLHGDGVLPELPSYNDLFPADRDVPSGPSPS